MFERTEILVEQGGKVSPLDLVALDYACLQDGHGQVVTGGTNFPVAVLLTLALDSINYRQSGTFSTFQRPP